MSLVIPLIYKNVYAALLYIILCILVKEKISQKTRLFKQFLLNYLLGVWLKFIACYQNTKHYCFDRTVIFTCVFEIKICVRLLKAHRLLKKILREKVSDSTTEWGNIERKETNPIKLKELKNNNVHDQTPFFQKKKIIRKSKSTI